MRVLNQQARLKRVIPVILALNPFHGLLGAVFDVGFVIFFLGLLFAAAGFPEASALGFMILGIWVIFLLLLAFFGVHLEGAP
jgi:hypothetical protein